MDKKYQESLDAIKDLINALPICEYAIGKESIGDLQELIDKYAELEKALNKASNMLAILVPPNAQMVTNCEGIYFNSVECQYEWLMNYAREEKAKEKL